MTTWIRWLAVFTLAAAVAVIGGPIGTPAPVGADSAPMWQSPVGLAPGLPGVKVRMAAEKVDIEVVERNNAVVANVQASFDMQNPGPDTKMLVGFPTFSILSTRVGSTIFALNSQQLRSFKASSGGQNYVPVEKQVDGMPWWVWEMVFPAGRTSRLEVSYEQQLANLENEGLARVFYVLTTGALWDGTIGDAVITVTAPRGALLDATPEGAETTPRKAVWNLKNIKPTEDIGLVYFPEASWKTLYAAEATIQDGSASPEDYLSGSRTVEGMMKGLYGSYPPVMRGVYMPKALQWATIVTDNDPGNVEAWEIIGAISFTDAQAKHVLRCWPAKAEDAFQRAADLGSTSAVENLKELAQYREFMLQVGFGIPEPCGMGTE